MNYMMKKKTATKVFPDRLPHEGELFNGWKISISNEFSLDGEAREDALEMFQECTAFLCLKNERAVVFVLANKLVEWAKTGNVAAVRLFWDSFVGATKYKKTVRHVRVRDEQKNVQAD